MLHEFLAANRAELIDRCRAKVAARAATRASSAELEHGIPLFLDQLIETLRVEDAVDEPLSRAISGPSGGGESSRIGRSAALHGRELLERGFTVDQVVHDYGDLCQSVTDLAFELGTPIRTREFRTLNRCLDNAIAGAVTAFGFQRDALIADRDAQALNERLGFLAHELRNLISTATLALGAIKAGNVGLAGATGAVLDRSLIELRNLVDRSLADVRVTAGMPPRRSLISLAHFIHEMQISAALEAQARECRFSVPAIDRTLAVHADRELLSSAVGNLLQNAFKYTSPHSEVILTARASGERVLIEVEDHCGGLHPGDAERMLLPFTQMSSDRSGLGLGLSICQRSVEANQGVLRVQDVPGSGCIFTIDLPRRSLPQ
jgi:signal transduction histidine kinase